jgi:hypothetical protein
MSELAVLTPSFAGDAEIFADLHRSVLEFTPEDTVHHVFVPERDKHLFARFEGPRCRLLTSRELLPARYVRIGKGDSYVNMRAPWPPVRRWVMQQAIKMAAAAQIDADVVVIADSDVVLVRPITVDRFMVGGRRLLFRTDDGVHAGMDRHVIWHRVSRELVGLPPEERLPLPDYVSSFNFWDPATVRAMLARITESTGKDWLDAFTSQLHISEFMLYGVYVDEVQHASGPELPGDTSICHNDWRRTPMSLEDALAFAEELQPEAVAMMISAKSNTPVDIRRAAIERCAEIVKQR